MRLLAGLLSGVACCAAALVAFPAGEAAAQTHVKGYYKSNGTYVAPHYRSKPNNTQRDNYSTYGNYNPYTGKKGTKTCGLYDSCY
jgi:hypothetical protein